jgi:hypothetical protein
MNARLIADIKASSYDTLSVDSAKVRVTAADGLAHVDTLAVGLPKDLRAQPERSGFAATEAASSSITSRSIHSRSSQHFSRRSRVNSCRAREFSRRELRAHNPTRPGLPRRLKSSAR